MTQSIDVKRCYVCFGILKDEQDSPFYRCDKCSNLISRTNNVSIQLSFQEGDQPDERTELGQGPDPDPSPPWEY